ncbi:hypothetical protein HYQ46_004349 [Verticillium longisporum]|nr:hypothetical protein HYQ46_004349 [Verticillium longisporum]
MVPSVQATSASDCFASFQSRKLSKRLTSLILPAYTALHISSCRWPSDSVASPAEATAAPKSTLQSQRTQSTRLSLTAMST